MNKLLFYRVFPLISYFYPSSLNGSSYLSAIQSREMRHFNIFWVNIVTGVLLFKKLESFQNFLSMNNKNWIKGNYVYSTPFLFDSLSLSNDRILRRCGGRANLLSEDHCTYRPKRQPKMYDLINLEYLNLVFSTKKFRKARSQHISSSELAQLDVYWWVEFFHSILYYCINI